MVEQPGNNLSERVNAIDEKARELAERIFELEPTERMGDGIHAAAALLLDEPGEMDHQAGDVLRRMAARAGL